MIKQSESINGAELLESVFTLCGQILATVQWRYTGPHSYCVLVLFPTYSYCHTPHERHKQNGTRYMAW